MRNIPENAERSDLGKEAEASLPYDESEWAHRLAEARLQRAKVLKQREETGGAPSQLSAPPIRAGARWGGMVTTAFVLGTLAGISLGASHWLQVSSAGIVSLATSGLGAGGTLGIPAEAPAAPKANIPAEGPSPAIGGRGIRQENVSDRPFFAPAAPDVVHRLAPAQPIAALALASEALPPDVATPAPLPTPPDIRPVAQAETGSSWWPGAKTIFVQAPPSVPATEMQEVASELRETGFVARDPARISLAIRNTHVRYYHGSDRLAAEAVAEMLDASARDFTHFEPSPKFGTIEVWLAGRPPVRAVAAKPTPSRLAQAQAERRGERPDVAHEEGDRSTLPFLLFRRSGNVTDRAAATFFAGGASDRGSSGRGGSPESSGTTSEGRGSAGPNASGGGGDGRGGAESRSSGNGGSGPSGRSDSSVTSAVSDAVTSATSSVSDIGRSASSRASDVGQSVSSRAGFD